MIKGHYINETLDQFLAKEEAARAKVQQCQKDPKLERSRKAVPAWFRCSDFAEGRIVLDSGTFIFRDGKLARISTSAAGVYERLVDDLSNRFGKRDRENEISFHNGFGATWTDRVSEWDEQDVYVVLTEDNNPVGPGGGLVCRIEVESHEFHENKKLALSNRRSPLD